MIASLSFLMVKDWFKPKISVRKFVMCYFNSPKLKLGVRLVFCVALAQIEYLIQ